ncbi:hypothetical protein [uncultured Ruthenibacterium sp.]|uniref:hypothetical protein n=1 Tax=uncultured Ruthenibacterium sp. TaxID=1905347 RepID=UPI00349E7733
MIHFVYMIGYFATGFVYESFWIKACAGYYAVLIAVRCFLLTSIHKSWERRRALLRYCLCGGLLCVLTVPLAGMVVQIVSREQGVCYSKELVYVAALYAFYAFIVAAVNLIRFRCLKNPILSATKSVSFVVALVAMLSLQTLMFEVFGGSENFQRKMNFVTGTAVCIGVLVIGAAMVWRGWKELNRPYPQKKEREETMKSNETFQYCYSAKRQIELQKIREKYLPSKEDPMSRVRELDRSVARRGSLMGLSTGFVGTLFLGIGMSCTMVWADTLFVLGLVVGLLGIVGVILAYPVSRIAAEKQRKKITPEILRLTQELME